MSTAVAVLGNVRFARGSANAASYNVAWNTSVAAAVACVAEAPRPRAVVVELKPRNFTETAAHFLRIATPVEWPDEHDID